MNSKNKIEMKIYKLRSVLNEIFAYNLSDDIGLDELNKLAELIVNYGFNVTYYQFQNKNFIDDNVKTSFHLDDRKEIEFVYMTKNDVDWFKSAMRRVKIKGIR